MSQRSTLWVIAMIAGQVAVGTPSAATAKSAKASSIREIQSPAAEGSGEPFLSAMSDGRLLMSWITRRSGKEFAVMMALRTNGKWTEPRTITTGKNLFVNWADFPSVVSTSSGTLFAHWLQKSGEGAYAYEIRLSQSRDEGRSWSPPTVLHDDGTATEHGFVSMIPDANGGVAVAWLDGRKMKPGEESGEMTLRYARLKADGKKVVEVELDPRTCECCQTGMAIASSGPVIVYRDRTSTETRDISAVRWEGKRWSQPRSISADGWVTSGCPVNGPQIDARGNKVVVAWFTGAREKARTYVAFSDNAGKSFSAPLQVDQGAPMGRVDVLMLRDGSAQVTWIERSGGGAEVRTRRVHPSGKPEASVAVGVTSAARASGFPQSVVAGSDIVFAWTEPGEPSRIRMSELKWEK